MKICEAIRQAYIVFQACQHGLSGCQGCLHIVIRMEKPGGRLVMPDQSMTTHGDVVVPGKIQVRSDMIETHGRSQIIALRIFLIFPPIQTIHWFHIILTGHTVKLFLYQLQMRWGIHVPFGDGHPHFKKWFKRCL